MASTDQPGEHDNDGMTASILGQPRKYTSHEAATAAGVSPQFAHRYWLASGYAAVDDKAVEFTESDVAVLRLMAGYVTQGIGTEHDLLQVTRLMGRTLSRLVESQVDIALELFEDSEPSEQITFARQLAHQVMPDVQFLLGQTWRRHMATAINRLNPGLEAVRSAPAGIGFADLVGFTDASRKLPETALLSLVESFEDGAADIIGDSGGRVVKMLGDEVLFSTTEPEALATIGLRLVATFGRARNEPGLRVGLAFGPVARHLGDVFGTTVNLASRLTSLTEPDTILISATLADALSGNPHFRFTPRHLHNVRGLGPMTSYVLTPHSSSGVR